MDDVSTALRVFMIMIPGLVVGALIMDSVRKVFSEDDRLLRKIFADQPVTMIASAVTIGSIVVWGVLSILGF